MSREPDERDERQAVRDWADMARIVALTALSAEDVWLKYAELGGDRSPDQVVDYLGGGVEWPAIETSILTHVMNERLVEQGLSIRSE